MQRPEPTVIIVDTAPPPDRRPVAGLAWALALTSLVALGFAILT